MTTPRTSPVLRVVVGVDGSDNSLAALRQAADEARCHGAELWPVIAWTPPGGHDANMIVPAPPSMLKIWTRDALRKLTTACAETLGPATGLHIRPKVIRGEADEVLTHYADRDSDILVMGASKHSRLHRLAFGSTSRKCLKKARCPVLVVQPDGAGSRATTCAAGAHHTTRGPVPVSPRRIDESRN